ncbi:hypothetical protein B0H13DRAFT_2376038 [Mycena leptocephala]|nr:hypothetical protein B0H13DRAFT_2376038 [Mycena leptocephala]
MDTNQARLKEGGTIKDQTPADACEDSYSDDDIPDLVPDDPIPNHLVARPHSGWYTNGPQCGVPIDILL